MTVTQTDPEAKASSTSIPNKAASLAVAALKAAHPEEWQTLLNEAYASLGAERKVRRTPEQAAADKAAAAEEKAAKKAAEAKAKALAAAQALAAQYPDILSLVNPALAAEVEASTPF